MGDGLPVAIREEDGTGTRWHGELGQCLGSTVDVLGHSPDEWLTRVPEHDRAALRSVRTNVGAYERSYRFRRDDGREVEIEEHGVVRPGHVVAVMRNVSARREEADRAERERSLLATAVEVAQVGAFWIELGPPTKVRWTAGVNRVFRSPSHAEEADFGVALERYAPTDRRAILQAFLECVRSGTPYDLTGHLVDEVGEARWVRSIGRAVRDAAGTIVGIEGAAQDVTALKDAEASADSSRLRLQQLADAMPFIVFTAAPDGEIAFTNKYFYLYTGASMSDAAAPHWPSALHHDDRAETLARWEQCRREETALDVTCRLRRRDRADRWFRVQAIPSRGGLGEITKWHGTAIDIHEHKELELGSRQVAERLQTILDSLDDAFLALDGAGKVVDANLEAEHKFGRGRALLGIPAWDVVPPLRGAPLEPACRRALSEQAPITLHDQLVAGPWVEVRIFPSREGLALFVRDVSTMKAEERRTAELASLLEKAQDAIIVRDLEGRATYLNTRAEQLYGWDRSDVLGRDVRAMQFARDPRVFDEANAATIREGQWTGELELVRRDGRALRVEARWTLLRRPDGTPYGVLGINTDVTERRRTEQQLMRAQRLESLGTLARGIAHDLNNVLTPILGSIAFFREKEHDPDKLDDLEVVEHQARRGAEMVRMLLLFAHGQPTGARAPIDVAKVVAEDLRVCREGFRSNIRVALRCPPDLRRVDADASQMHQLFSHLFENARDAMPRGGTLSVSLENVVLERGDGVLHETVAPGPFVLACVEDDGAGIPAEVQARVFEPFYSTKSLLEGSGLGLSACEAIVRLHGGFILLHSEVGRGTRFRVYLPAAAGGPSTSVVPEDASRLPRGDGELILVVDDDEAVLRMTSRMLERYGYRVVAAGNGALAVSAFVAQQAEVALVVTDMSMPVMDGPAMIVALHALRPDVPIIASSGLDVGPRQREAADGVADYLPKPYPAELLLQAIRRLLVARRAGRGAP